MRHTGRILWLLACGWACGQQLGPVRGDAWAPLRILLGEWTGEGSGGVGQGAGWFSFLEDLQGKVVVRRNHAEYPAARNRAAFSHDDLMVVYRQKEEEPLRAIYFDSEGHTIPYRVETAEGGDVVRFVSDAPAAAEPRYRLTYRKTGPDTLALKFEIAPPGKPEEFSTYIEARARRKGEK